jgi:serine/threonine protein kinase
VLVILHRCVSLERTIVPDYSASLVQPENVLLVFEGSSILQLKLSDMGVSVQSQGVHSRSTAVGTLAYMAPESGLSLW